MSARSARALSILVRPLRSLFDEATAGDRTLWSCRLCPYEFADHQVRTNPEAGTYALYQLVKHLRGHIAR